jgi:hypothetical protein
MGYIGAEQVAARARKLKNSDYGRYLERLVGESGAHAAN